MPELDKERQHLVEADGHIAAGEQRITSQMLIIERLRAASRETKAAEALLAQLQNTLEAWNAHRNSILQEIARLEGAAPPPLGVSTS